VLNVTNTLTIASGAGLTVDAKGTVSANAVANSGDLIVNGGSVSIPNGITGTGSTNVEAGSTLATSQIIQDSLMIGAGSTVTITPSGSGEPATDASVELAGRMALEAILSERDLRTTGAPTAMELADTLSSDGLGGVADGQADVATTARAIEEAERRVAWFSAGEEGSVATVPEPSTFGLLTLGLFGSAVGYTVIKIRRRPE
jgi:hypothetical protein